MQVKFIVDENLLVLNFAAWSSRFLAAELGKPAIVKSVMQTASSN